MRGSFVARLLADKKSVVVKAGLEERAARCASQPDTYLVPPEQGSYALMVVRLSTVDPADMARVLMDSWRRSAPSSLVALYDAGRAAP